MINKGNKLYSIINNKCPKCHEGSFFTSPHAYDLKTFSDMPDECPVCHQTYQPEPGYYYGAMYVSYALNVAIFVTVWVATNVLFQDGVGVWWLVLASIIAGVGLMPLSFRLARLIWINFFIRYEARATSGSSKESAITSR